MKNSFSQIGYNIKTVRERLRISPKDFASRIDVDPHTLGNYENHRTEIPHSKVELAAKELGMSVCDLVTDHLKQIVNINTPHDNNVVYNSGVVQSKIPPTLLDFMAELRNQLHKKDEQMAKKDELISNLMNRILILEGKIDKMLK